MITAFYKPFIFLWRLWVYFHFLFWLICIGPLVYVSTFHSRFEYTHFLIRCWARAVFYCSGFRYKLQSNIELTNGKQYIIIANHTSMIDILLMYLLHPHHPLSFVGKKELVSIPIFGSVYKRVCVMVDRQSLKSKARVYELSAQKIKEGRNLILFPEGGVPDDASIILDSFREGAFNMASQYQIPIVVYTFTGIKEQFPFSHFSGFPGKSLIYREAILDADVLNSNDKVILKDTSFNLIYSRLKEYYQLNNEPHHMR